MDRLAWNHHDVGKHAPQRVMDATQELAQVGTDVVLRATEPEGEKASGIQLAGCLGKELAGEETIELRRLRLRQVHDDDTVYWDADFIRPTALVLGGEDKGVRRLVREHCDYVVSLPLMGKISSLNVSVAAGALLFEVLRQRRTKSL